MSAWIVHPDDAKRLDKSVIAPMDLALKGLIWPHAFGVNIYVDRAVKPGHPIGGHPKQIRRLMRRIEQARMRRYRNGL